MEYDYDMKAYGDPSSTDIASRYTYRPNRVAGDGSIVPGGIVSTDTNSTRELFGDNKVEVDCMMCHMDGLRTGAAWYKSLGCSSTNPVGPADDPTCSGPQFAGVDTDAGTFYDSYNRNISVSLGYLKQAATAGLGALIDLASGTLSNVPSTIPAEKITSTPNSNNCAMCHARTNSDSIGLPMEAAKYGGMTTGFGNFFRMTAAEQAFDFDEIDGSGAIASGKDGKNDTLWNEFGCKTGMGKRSQRSGVGTQDRFGFGICLGCATFNAMGGDMTTGWFSNGLCAMPSVQAACNEAAGTTLQGSEGQWMGIFEDPMTMLPKKVAGKMSDTDVHDAAGVKCATCHYTLSGDFAGRTISSGATSYTYPGIAGVQKMDHQVAQGWSTLEKANDVFDGTVTCEGCHIEGTHPNKGTAPVPAHAGFPAFHFEKIDCRTCHIPRIFSSPGRLLFRDWTTGGYRQTDGANGNANHFDFAFNFMEGGATPMIPLKQWIKVQEPTGAVVKIAPGLPSMLPMWVGKGSPNGADYIPLKTRDVTAAAALVAANNPSFGIRINETNDVAAFNGFQLTDPLKIESAAKIAAMRAELLGTGAGLATHSAYVDPKMNLQPFFFDPSHGITDSSLALGSPSAGGCVMCHSSSVPGNPNYSPYSVGFFDGQKELLKNGFMQMADYDCGGDDMHQLNASLYGNTPGGWTAANTMCQMFDSNASGTCDGDELLACKTYIASNLFPMFGMPADISTAMPVDGIDMMQMFSIREGSFALGCNPVYSFFGFPTAGRMTGPGSMTNGTGPTNGCEATDFYSRDETRLYYKKNLQQVQDGGANKVFGNIKVGPTFATYDIGSKCITDPMTGATGTCTNGGYIATTVSEKTLLGYDTATLDKLMNGSAVSTMNCVGCHPTQTHTTHVVTYADTCTTCHTTTHITIPSSATMSSCEGCHSQTMSTLSHSTTGTTTPQNCGSCHATAGVVPTISACESCHGTPVSSMVDLRFSQIHSGSLPRPAFSWTNDAVTPFKILFSGASSTNCSTYSWNFGDGSSATGITTDHTYALATSQTVTMTCGDASTSASVSKTVYPRAAAAPAITPAANVVTDGYHVTLTDTTVASGMTGTITIMWGDGQRSYIRMGGEADHLYRRARTYNVMMMLRTDTPGYRVEASRAKIPVTIERLIISGLVTKPGGTTPFPGVIMTLKHNGNTVKKAVTNSFGAYTFRNVVPNVVLETYPTPTTYSDYTIEALKRTGRLVSDGTTTTREVYSWTPATITTTVTNATVTVNDFEAQPLP